ncbi:lipid asymmetry maintenance protein MlaB [uncultured Sphingomonas sp.]|uniref:STAS domain-containing protein n=1 Tax=uncultured Sphingomonas sp. TaxID=158754 RepID=UPI00262B8337|nr:STAS domain-containing protein [uncultured Sphingomonas sp.]
MTRLALPSTLDLAAATALLDTLRGVSGDIVLDAGGVERIGVAGIQLLLSAQGTADGAGHALTIEAPSEAFCTAIRISGADALLADR